MGGHLKEKTGRSLDDWLALVKKSGPFALGARKAGGRLVDTGGFAKKDRITHRIPISSPAEIDSEVKRWFRLAYDEDAG